MFHIKQAKKEDKMIKRGYIKKFTLPCLFILFLIFSTAHFSFSAQPGLQLHGDGIITWTHKDGIPIAFTGLSSWVRVIDYDGIADDGSSHTVTVTYPDGFTEKTLWFVNKENAYTARYEFWDDIDMQSGDYPTYSGTYTYRVTDESSEWSEATDDLVADPITPPDESTLLPNFGAPQSIVAFFDDVYINDSLYDNFDAGFNDTKWYGPGWTVNIDYPGGEARFQQSYNPGAGSHGLSIVNPTDINKIAATIRIDSSTTDLPRGRVIGTFCQNNGGNVQANVGIRGAEAVYTVYNEYWDGNHYIAKYLVPLTSIGTVTPGKNYKVSLEWDEPTSTLTFMVIGLDTDDSFYDVPYTATYTVPGPVSSIDGGCSIGVANWLEVDTTPTFDWELVDEATYYVVRIYGLNNNTIHYGTTKTPPYKIPPGILKPNGIYKYRIQVSKDNQGFEWDNGARTNQDLTRFITGPVQSQEPYVDLNSQGVQTWTNDILVGTYTSFNIKVHDAQGVPGNIESVKVLFPDGVTEVNLYLDYNDSSTNGTYRGDYFGAIQNGAYTFTAIDKDGNSHSRVETPTNLTIDNIDPPSEISLQPANNTVVGNTGASFDWDDVSGAAFYQLRFYDKDLNYLFQIYTIESEYTLPPGLLEEETLYRYSINARREFFEDNSDNGASAPAHTWDANTFFTTSTNGSATPALSLDSYGVAVLQMPHPATGNPVYELNFYAMVTDLDGVPENIRSVEVTYPDGVTTRLLKYLDLSDWGSNYLNVEYYTDPSSIQTGDYTFKVVDFDGNEVTLTDKLTDVVSNVLPWPANLSPADGTILSNTTPIITWDSVSDASYYKVRILRSWGGSTVHWSPEVESGTSYMVPEGVLDTNRTYSYRVYAYREAIGEEVDFFSGSNFWHSTNNHFTVPGTPTGSNVDVQPVDNNTGDTPVTIVFNEVTDAGTTSLTTSEGGEPLPIGFKLGEPSTYYELETTASYNGPIEVCINYSGTFYEDEAGLKLFHYENDQWIDVTTSLDSDNNIICGQSASLSPFVVLEPNNVMEVQIDIKPGSESNCFNQNEKGVIPVVLFGGLGLDVKDVVIETLSLQGLSVKVAGKSSKYLSDFEDVDKDGQMDIVIHFEDSDQWMSPGGGIASLTGLLTDGTSIEGRDIICIVP
jgi:hypothetical protein